MKCVNWKLIEGNIDDFIGCNPSDATHKFVHDEKGHYLFTKHPEIIRTYLFTLVARRELVDDNSVTVNISTPCGEDDLNECTGAPESHNKYLREIKPGVWVDVYDVLSAWGVLNPALQHLIKKALQTGERGHKTRGQDLQDIIDSAIRAKELEQK